MFINHNADGFAAEETELSEEELETRSLALRRRHGHLTWAVCLGLLLPLALLTIMLVAAGKSNHLFLPLLSVFKTFSMIVLAVLGGIRLGHALNKELQQSGSQTRFDNRSLLLSIIPIAMAFSAMFFENHMSIAVLLLAYCGQGAWDSISAAAGRLPSWFGPMRITMTLLAALLHIIVFLVSY